MSDFELIKRITIKDFGNFINRPFLGFAFNLSRQSLIGLEGEEWKDVRRTLSPTFSASKMKQMSNIVNKMITTLCNEIEKKCKAQEEFDIYENFQRLTLEVIGECALAIKLQCQTQYDDTFFSVLQAFMKGTGGFSISRIIAYVPGLKYFLLFYYRRTKMFKMIQHILQNLTATIQKRRLENSTQKATDILQLMLDAGQDKDSHADEEDSFLSTTALGQKQKKPLTDEQITANSWIFILAGFETTATALAYTAHVLTVHPDVQEKVYQEIKVQIPVCITNSLGAHKQFYLDLRTILSYLFLFVC